MAKFLVAYNKKVVLARVPLALILRLISLFSGAKKHF